MTPLVTLRANWEKLFTTLAITPGAQLMQNTRTGAVCSADVVHFFQHLLRHVPGKLVVVLDNAGIHPVKAVQTFVACHKRLSLVYLPPYAPELNPIELV